MRTLKELLKRTERIAQIRDPKKFCFCGTSEQVAAMTAAEKAEYQIIMTESEECHV